MMARVRKWDSAASENGIYFFQEINEVLNSCKDIDEFDIIPAIKPENESCPFVLDKTKLGIFSWCVKDLFCYVYTELKAARKCNTTTSHKEGDYLMDLTRVLLLVHSEDYTVWNLRKCYVARQTTIYGRTELDFCALVLRKHPRSAETFSHRRWLINLFQEKKEKMLEEQQFLQEELDLTLNCAERYRDNYISWDHRCWLVNHFMFDKVNWLEEELNSTSDWLWTHVSDNCVYHFRQHLLKNLSRSCSLTKTKSLLLEEFKLADEILKHYPVFQTVWCHRRFLISFWSTKFDMCPTCLQLWQSKHSRCQEQKSGSDLFDLEVNCSRCEDKGELVSIQCEVELCRQIIGYPEETRQAHLAASHLTWLDHFCKNLLERTAEQKQEGKHEEIGRG